MRRAPILALALLWPALGLAQEAPAPDLGGTWVVEDLGGAGVPDSVRATLEFGADGTAAGLGGCNRWRAPWSQEGGGLAFGPAMATRMACPPAVMEFEGRFFGALAATRGAASDETGALRLLDDAGGVLLLARRDG